MSDSMGTNSIDFASMGRKYYFVKSKNAADMVSETANVDSLKFWALDWDQMTGENRLVGHG